MKRMLVLAVAAAAGFSAQARAEHDQPAEVMALAAQQEQTATLTAPPQPRYLDKDEAARALKDLGYALVLDLHYWDHAYQGRALKAGQGWTTVRIDPVTGAQLSANLYAPPSTSLD